MPRQRTWSDEELVRLVWDYRLNDGACTIGQLRKATGMTLSALHARVGHLVDAGELVKSDVWGSIRAADERLMREVKGKLVAPR